MKLLDQSVLEGLRDVLPEDALNGLLRQVSRDLIPDSLEAVALVKAGAWDQHQLMIHRLTGTVSSFGCDALTASLRSVEAGLRAHPLCVPSLEILERIVSVARETAAALETAASSC